MVMIFVFEFYYRFLANGGNFIWERGLKMELKLKGLNKTQSAAALFFVGLLLGVLCANLCRKYYISDMKVLDYTYNSILKEQDLDYIGLLQYTLVHNIKEFLIFWIFCFTLLGIPYVIFSIVYKGVEVGFLISAVTILYGGKGILLFFAYIMPQALVYVPVMLLCLQKGYQLAQQSFYRSRNHTEVRRSMLLGYFALILMLLALLGIGAIVETYFGSAILKKTLELCV